MEEVFCTRDITREYQKNNSEQFLGNPKYIPSSKSPAMLTQPLQCEPEINKSALGQVMALVAKAVADHLKIT